MRDAEAGDLAFMTAMLAEAASWRGEEPPDTEAVMADPYMAHYVEGWPLPGDVGVIAELDQPVGAAWYRFLSESDPGYGFVAASIPEITIGVTPASRGLGVGTALLHQLAATAKASGIESLSLSVEQENPALALYRRMGFVQAGGRLGALTLVLDL